MASSFDGIWWSVELPAGWRGKPEQECATFQSMLGLGALQISSARNDAGPVTDEDLKEFAEGRLPAGIEVKVVTYGSCDGFTAEYAKEGSFWKEWWLRSGHLMVYATYNVRQGEEGLEMGDVERILRSLTPAS